MALTVINNLLESDGVVHSNGISIYPHNAFEISQTESVQIHTCSSAIHVKPLLVESKIKPIHVLTMVGTLTECFFFFFVLISPFVVTAFFYDFTIKTYFVFLLYIFLD